jgi:N-acetylmuramoyl-L-alanine amidase
MSGFAPDQPGACVRPSPSFGERRLAGRPDILLLHYTGMETGQAAEDRLCDPASEVSCHYLVHEDGRIVQMVRESDRAWHAGRSFWQGETDINSRSVGVEIVNPGHAFGYRDFPAVQIASVIELCRGIIARHEIPAERVLAHSDVAPGRKVDPGEKFPWRQLARAGVGHWVEPAPAGGEAALPTADNTASLQRMLAAYGYGVELTGILDAPTRIVVEAFQRHFRPARVDGIPDPSTVDTLRRLLAALPSTARQATA